MSIFHYLKELAPDANFGMAAKAKADKHPKKIDLCLGAYRNEDGEPQLLSAVREAKKAMSLDPNETEEYLPLHGSEKFVRNARDLLFLADDNKDRYENLSERICSFHCVSATNALYTALTILRENIPFVKKAYASNPCWANYERLATSAGLEFGLYPYFSDVNKGVDFEEMLAALRSYDKGSVIILQACCHNPSGFDLTPEQWAIARDVMIEAELIPLLDIAYQGLGTGDMKQDSIALRIFLEKNFDFFVSQSFSKNMSLYSARVGVLHCVCKSDYIANKNILMGNLSLLGRARYGSPTRHGAEVAYRLMSDPVLNKMWTEELQSMTHRIIGIRRELCSKLEAMKVRGSWKHLTKQIGMFAYLGITKEQVETLQKKFHIYMMLDGRISVAGLNSSNMDYFVQALHTVIGEDA